MWRPNYVTNEQGQLELEAAQTLNDQVFRDEFGRPNLSRDAGLKLELGDFAPKDLARGISGSFLVDSATLCRFLNEAEQEEQEGKQKQGIVEHLEPGAKKRRRENMPPEDSIPRMNEDMQTMNEGFKRESQQMTALIGRLSHSYRQKNTINSHGILQRLLCWTDHAHRASEINMEFGGSLYASSAFVRSMALSANQASD